MRLPLPLGVRGKGGALLVEILERHLVIRVPRLVGGKLEIHMMDFQLDLLEVKQRQLED